MKDWMLTDEEIQELHKEHNWLIFSHELYRLNFVANAQAKKLMEYLEESTMLNHMKTRDELSCMESCDVCKLLKEVGLE